MFNWLNLSTKKSFSTEKGETMKTSKTSKQDRLVNALKDGEALTESAMKHRFSIANPRATVSALRMKGYVLRLMQIRAKTVRLSIRWALL